MRISISEFRGKPKAKNKFLQFKFTHFLKIGFAQI